MKGAHALRGGLAVAALLAFLAGCTLLQGLRGAKRPAATTGAAAETVRTPIVLPEPEALPGGRVSVWRDVRYGPHALQALDLFAPNAAGPHPMVVFVHGGEFFEGDKSSHASKGRAFAEAGYLFASINYRLSPEVSHPAHVEDVAKAIRWVRDAARELGGDASRLFVSGHSSGAHLAALVGTDARYLKGEGMHPSELGGIVLLDGAGYDIETRLKTANRRTRKLYMQAFGDTAEDWKEASPPVQVEQGESLPRFLIVYAGSMPAPRQQAQKLARVLQDSGARAELVHIPERNHVTLEKRLGEKGDRATQHISRFVDAHGSRPQTAASGAP